jgi:hypothetical protein
LCEIIDTRGVRAEVKKRIKYRTIIPTSMVSYWMRNMPHFLSSLTNVCAIKV